MSVTSSCNGIARLAQLAAADPYTAFEPIKGPLAEQVHAAPPTANSITKPPALDKQLKCHTQLSPQQSTASALHLLEQLLNSPSDSSSISSVSEVNSRAVGVVFPVQSLTGTLNKVEEYVDTASTSRRPAQQLQRIANKSAAAAVRKPGGMQIRAAASLDVRMGPETGSCKPDCSQENAVGVACSMAVDGARAAGPVEAEASEWTIIEDFCRSTVPKTWLQMVLHGWFAVFRSRVKWRCIQQVCLLCLSTSLHTLHIDLILQVSRLACSFDFPT